jgi:hypothetical protein
VDAGCEEMHDLDENGLLQAGVRKGADASAAASYATPSKDIDLLVGSRHCPDRLKNAPPPRSNPQINTVLAPPIQADRFLMIPSQEGV